MLRNINVAGWAAETYASATDEVKTVVGGQCEQSFCVLQIISHLIYN